jgi:hypothetical protein
MTQRDFDAVSQNIAESIDDAISTVPRERERRIALIRHSVRRAMVLGYKAARNKAIGMFTTGERGP